MTYCIHHDPGEQDPLPQSWVDPSEEPVPAIKDVYATMSVQNLQEKKELPPNLYEHDSEKSHHGVMTKKQQLIELKAERKKHLVIKHGSANVVGSVGEMFASEGVIKIRDPR